MTDDKISKNTGVRVTEEESKKIEKMIEDLKCCGNCIHRFHLENKFHVQEWCNKHEGNVKNSCETCLDHEFDGLDYRTRLMG